MAKKTILLLAACIAFAALGGRCVKHSGYFEPYPEAEYLTDEEAEARPLYGELSNKEQAVYTALYREISEKKTQISLPFEVSGEMYSKLYCMLEKQESALFYIDSTYYTAQKIRTAQVELREDSNSAISAKENELAMTSDKIMAGIPSETDDFDKALYIHDYIAENCKYEAKSETGYGSTAYGCLVENSANCEGYAKAFSYLANKAGITAVLVTGTTNKGENHAWNKVKIDGLWYNLDVTWDDTDDSQNERHVYFLCSDEDFLRSHTSSGDFGDEFECVSEEASYYKRLDLFAADLSDADRIMRREISLGTGIIEIKLADDNIYEEFLREYFEEERIFDVISEYGMVSSEGTIKVNMRENEEENCITIWMK